MAVTASQCTAHPRAGLLGLLRPRATPASPPPSPLRAGWPRRPGLAIPFRGHPEQGSRGVRNAAARAWPGCAGQCSPRPQSSHAEYSRPRKQTARQNLRAQNIFLPLFFLNLSLSLSPRPLLSSFHRSSFVSPRSLVLCQSSLLPWPALGASLPRAQLSRVSFARAGVGLAACCLDSVPRGRHVTELSSYPCSHVTITH